MEKVFGYLTAATLGVLTVAGIYQIGRSQNAVPLWRDANQTVRSVTNTVFKG